MKITKTDQTDKPMACGLSTEMELELESTVEPRLTTTPFIRPPRYYGHILSNQKYKTLTHFIILKTPLMRPPRYYDQDFMAQRWSYLRGSTVLVFEERP